MGPRVTDVLEEFMHGEPLKQTDVIRFVDQGIPPIYLLRTAAGTHAHLNRDQVVFQGDGFEFRRYVPNAERTEVAFTFIVFNQEGEAADIVAWRPPDLALWRNRVFALGEEQIWAPTLGEPIRIHAGVLDWFRAGREGLVILNYSIAAHALRNVGPLAVETPAHAADLAARLTIPPPPIRVSPFMSIEVAA